MRRYLSFGGGVNSVALMLMLADQGIECETAQGVTRDGEEGAMSATQYRPRQELQAVAKTLGRMPFSTPLDADERDYRRRLVARLVELLQECEEAGE